jgi:hypothetical protein
MAGIIPRYFESHTLSLEEFASLGEKPEEFKPKLSTLNEIIDLVRMLLGLDTRRDALSQLHENMHVNHLVYSPVTLLDRLGAILPCELRKALRFQFYYGLNKDELRAIDIYCNGKVIKITPSDLLLTDADKEIIKSTAFSVTSVLDKLYNDIRNDREKIIDMRLFEIIKEQLGLSKEEQKKYKAYVLYKTQSEGGRIEKFAVINKNSLRLEISLEPGDEKIIKETYETWFPIEDYFSSLKYKNSIPEFERLEKKSFEKKSNNNELNAEKTDEEASILENKIKSEQALNKLYYYLTDGDGQSKLIDRKDLIPTVEELLKECIKDRLDTKNTNLSKFLDKIITCSAKEFLPDNFISKYYLCLAEEIKAKLTPLFDKQNELIANVEKFIHKILEVKLRLFNDSVKFVNSNKITEDLAVYTELKVVLFGIENNMDSLSEDERIMLLNSYNEIMGKISIPVIEKNKFNEAISTEDFDISNIYSKLLFIKKAVKGGIINDINKIADDISSFCIKKPECRDKVDNFFALTVALKNDTKKELQKNYEVITYCRLDKNSETGKYESKPDKIVLMYDENEIASYSNSSDIMARLSDIRVFLKDNNIKNKSFLDFCSYKGLEDCFVELDRIITQIKENPEDVSSLKDCINRLDVYMQINNLIIRNTLECKENTYNSYWGKIKSNFNEASADATDSLTLQQLNNVSINLSIIKDKILNDTNIAAILESNLEKVKEINLSDQGGKNRKILAINAEVGNIQSLVRHCRGPLHSRDIGRLADLPR